MGVSAKYDLRVGDRFDRLVVTGIKEFQTGKDGRSKTVRYECLCNCGGLVFTPAYILVSGHLRSCGCLRRDKASESGKKRTKHGFARTGSRPPEYMTWVRMRRRCENQSSQDYENYGGRGISVCDRWKDFSNFICDMGERPAKGYSIERIDNNGNYEPGNCKWATIKEQNRNKRSIYLLEIDGAVKGLGDWAEESGTNLETIRSRLRRGWNGREAVFGILKQKMERVGNRWGRRATM